MAYTNFTGPVQADFGFQTASYTVADLPAVEDNIFLIASDANGGTGTVVFGKSGQWIDARTDLPVSTNPPTPVPYVGLVAPDVGSIAGGENITITGFNFTGVTAVSIGGTPVTSFALVDDATITAVTAPRAAGNVYVNVTNAYGTSSNTPGATYIYQVPVVNPVITSTSVPGGWVGGGSSNFVINGTGFTGTSAVTFNGNSASFVELSDTSILITNFPGGVTGSAFIIVTTSAGGASIPYMSWDYLTTGVITSISPNSGVSTGGTNITVSGYGFNTTNQLQFEIPGAGVASATGLSVISDNELTAVTPNILFTGPANARVSNPSYGFGAYANGVFTFTTAGVAPVITSTSVPGGFAYGGAANFTISGTGFNSVTDVLFNGGSASYSVLNSSTILITNIPDNGGSAGSANIQVINPSGSSNVYTGWSYVQTATITSITPSSGSNAGGSTISFTGYGFNHSGFVQFNIPGAGSVNSSTPTVNNDNEMTISLPSTVYTGASDVRVFNNNFGYGAYDYSAFTYTAASVAPVINVVNGAPQGSTTGAYYNGCPSTSFVIEGSGFNGTTSVTVQGLPCSFTVNNDSQIAMNSIPAGTVGSAPLVVTNPGGSATFSTFVFVDSPVITFISPNTAQNDTSVPVTLNGYGFTTMTNLQFNEGGTYSGPVATVYTDNYATSFSPTGFPAGVARIRGLNPTWAGPWLENSFTFTAAASAPVIAGFNFAGGDVGGGNASLSMTGSHFTGTTSVTFNGNPATFSVVNDGEISISNFPAGTAGAASIVATNAIGASTPYTGWTYVTQPVLQQIVPNTGLAGTATGITYIGYGFNSATLGYWFQGAAAGSASITIPNDNIASGNTPTGFPAGSCNVCLLDSGYAPGPILNNAFTYTNPPSWNVINNGNSKLEMNGAFQASNIAVNQNTGTQLIIQDGLDVSISDSWASSSGPWDPTGYYLDNAVIVNPVSNYGTPGYNLGFSGNGRMFISLDSGAGQVYGYVNGSAWDWNTGASQTGPSPVMVFFNTNGVGWTCDYNGTRVYAADGNFLKQWDLASQYNIGSMTNISTNAYNVGAVFGANNTSALQISNDGYRIYFLASPGGNSTLELWKATLGTAFDLSTLSTCVMLCDIAAQISSIFGTSLNSTFNSCGMAIKLDTEDKMIVLVHTNDGPGNAQRLVVLNYA